MQSSPHPPFAQQYIFVRTAGLLVKIKFSDIYYIQACGDYVNIYTTTKKHTVHIPLSEIEMRLPEGMFFRPHRSYLIQLDKVDTIEKNVLRIDKHPLPIAERYKKDLLKKLNLL